VKDAVDAPSLGCARTQWEIYRAGAFLARIGLDPLPPLTNDGSWGTCFDGAVVSLLRSGVQLVQHFIHGVDDRLRLIQLNVVA
jgi:hypothetical protein